MKYYLIVFLTLLYIINVFSFLNYILSLFGQLIVLSVISWQTIQWIKRLKTKQWITPYKKTVLITGCDSGFGYATALKLNELGYIVYATVLKPESESSKQLLTSCPYSENFRIIRMDVTNDREIEKVFRRVKTELETNGEELCAVVNSAAINDYCPIDWGTIDICKNITNVNTLGTVRVTRTFLPLLRKSKGHIVNMSSLTGRLSFPYNAFYSMNSRSIIAFSDALRRENQNFDLKVSTIEPFAYKTKMFDFNRIKKRTALCWRQTSDEIKGFYTESFNDRFVEYLSNVSEEANPNIIEVVKCVIDAVRNPDPEPRYLPNFSCCARLLFDLFVALPIPIQDFVMSFTLVDNTEDEFSDDWVNKEKAFPEE